MTNGELQRLFAGISFLLVLMVFFYFLGPFFFGSGSGEGTPLKDTIAQKAQELGFSGPDTRCEFAVSSECRVLLRSPSFDCSKDDVDIRARLRRQLGDILSRPECRQAQTELGQKCGEGCILDHASIINIPTRIETSFVEESELLCRVDAMRSTSLRGRCITADGN